MYICLTSVCIPYDCTSVSMYLSSVCRPGKSIMYLVREDLNCEHRYFSFVYMFIVYERLSHVWVYSQVYNVCALSFCVPESVGEPCMAATRAHSLHVSHLTPHIYHVSSACIFELFYEVNHVHVITIYALIGYAFYIHLLDWIYYLHLPLLNIC